MALFRCPVMRGLKLGYKQGPLTASDIVCYGGLALARHWLIALARHWLIALANGRMTRRGITEYRGN